MYALRRLFVSLGLIITTVHAHEAPEVVALGSVVMDHLVLVDDAFLKEKVGGAKGGREPIEAARLQELLSIIPDQPRMIPGGSAVNQVKGLARLGWSCRVVGNVGNDLIGRRCIDELNEYSIESVLASEPLPTGQVLCMVTPDHERTMRTYIGAAGVTDNIRVEPRNFEGARLLHIEGYQYVNHELVLEAARIAHELGCLVSLDLASFEMIRAHREFLETFIPSSVDILFCNSDEALELTGLPPEEAVCALSRKVRVAVVTRGPCGCVVAAGGRMVACPCVGATPIDTTGAGDLFSSGFLHGYLQGAPLYQCGMYGNIVAARCIEEIGAHLSDQSWERVKAELVYHSAGAAH